MWCLPPNRYNGNAMLVYRELYDLGSDPSELSNKIDRWGALITLRFHMIDHWWQEEHPGLSLQSME